MDKKYLLISMDDDKAGKIADVFGNKTCKKIITFLAEKESSEKEIADALKMPINTIEYNLKKLLNAELIEKTKNFFWSRKGKKIGLYRLSNKSIIISPKKKEINSEIKSILPVILLSGIAAFIIKNLTSSLYEIKGTMLKSAAEMAPPSVNLPPISIIFQIPSWLWFIFGAIFSLIVFLTVLILIKMKGGNR